LRNVTAGALVLLSMSATAEAASWTGQASYYKAPREGTCAHKTLPFGTRLKVTNLANHRSTVLTVADRGPFIRGRIVDVSLGAANTLGMRHAGVVPVHIETVSAYTENTPAVSTVAVEPVAEKASKRFRVASNQRGRKAAVSATAPEAQPSSDFWDTTSQAGFTALFN